MQTRGPGIKALHQRSRVNGTDIGLVEGVLPSAEGLSGSASAGVGV